MSLEAVTSLFHLYSTRPLVTTMSCSCLCSCSCSLQHRRPNRSTSRRGTRARSSLRFAKNAQTKIPMHFALTGDWVGVVDSRSLGLPLHPWVLMTSVGYLSGRSSPTDVIRAHGWEKRLICHQDLPQGLWPSHTARPVCPDAQGRPKQVPFAATRACSRSPRGLSHNAGR